MNTFAVPARNTYLLSTAIAEVAAGLGIRPEHLSRQSPSVMARPGVATMSAPVEVVEPTGAETMAVMKFGDLEVVGRFSPDEAPKTGEDMPPDSPAVATALAGLSPVIRDGAIAIPVSDAAALQDILARCSAHRIPLSSVTLRKPDLETVFLALTGRALRD